jgi:hypothetical protein
MAIAMWNRHGQLVVATDDRLLLVWKGRVTRRERVAEFRWSALTGVEAHALAITLDFGGEAVRLSGVTPAGAYDALLALAHRRLGHEAADPDELRELARRKLGGKLLAFGWDNELRMLPGRLQPGERVERLAVATADFEGLLAVTDRRVLLLKGGVRAGAERIVEVARSDVRGAVPTEGGLRVEHDGGALVLLKVTPPDRTEELLAVLAR